MAKKKEGKDFFNTIILTDLIQENGLKLKDNPIIRKLKSLTRIIFEVHKKRFSRQYLYLYIMTKGT